MLSPPSSKEAVVDADPLDPQRLGEQPAQQRLRRRPRARPPAGPITSGAAAPTVQLAVRRQRQRRQHHEGLRHHVLRQPLPDMLSQHARQLTAAPGRATT